MVYTIGAGKKKKAVRDGGRIHVGVKSTSKNHTILVNI